MIQPDKMAQYARDPLAFIGDLTLPIPGKPRFGDRWAGFQVAAFEALAPSLLALAAGEMPPITDFWLERVKGAAKDSDVAAAVLWLLAFSPELLEMRAGASDFDQAAELRKCLRDWVRVNGSLAARVEIQVSKALNPTTGSVLDFLTSDATGSHGSRPALTVVDELSHMGGHNQEFAETLADDRDKVPWSVMITATNAGAKSTWQWDWREAAREQAEQSSTAYFQKVTEPAPWITPQRLAAAERRNSPSRYARLWRGEWIAGTGDGLDPAWIQRAIQDYARWPDRENWPLVAIGVDAGVTGDHASIVCLRGSPSTQKIRVFDVLDYEPPVNLNDFLREILRVALFHGASLIRSDPWQMLAAIQTMVAMGLDAAAVAPTPAVQTAQATALTTALRDGVLEIYDHPLLLEDLQGARIVDRQVSDTLRGMAVSLARNERGHSDRLAALLTILPGFLEVLPHAAVDLAIQNTPAAGDGVGCYPLEPFAESWGGGDAMKWGGG